MLLLTGVFVVVVTVVVDDLMRAMRWSREERPRREWLLKEQQEGERRNESDTDDAENRRSSVQREGVSGRHRSVPRRAVRRWFVDVVDVPRSLAHAYTRLCICTPLHASPRQSQHAWLSSEGGFQVFIEGRGGREQETAAVECDARGRIVRLSRTRMAAEAKLSGSRDATINIGTMTINIALAEASTERLLQINSI